MKKEKAIETINEIWAMASTIEHGYILTDAINAEGREILTDLIDNAEAGAEIPEADYLNIKTWQDTCSRIADIEVNYTTAEIEQGNLLCDVW